MTKALHAFLTAVQFLTRVPVPGGMNRPGADPALLRQSVVFFPLVGGLIGLGAGASQGVIDVERGGTLIMVDDDRLPLEPNEKPELKMIRFRTLGCYPLSGAIESSATTIEEIVAEMQTARVSERQGRLIDTDEAASMEKKKREGYF